MYLHSHNYITEFKMSDMGISNHYGNQTSQICGSNAK